MRQSAAACLLLGLTLPAQGFDAIGVTFTGQILRLDTTTGATSGLGTGQLGQNALAVTADGRIWTTVRSGIAAPFQFHLALIDPHTGAETLPFGNQDVGDLRGLCNDGANDLMAIRDVGGPDEFVRIDTTTGVVTAVGPTGFSGIQALDFTAAGLRAWDLTAGLLRIDVNTGAASDPFPGVGGPAGLQWLATEPLTGRTFVGRGTVQEVDLQTGLLGPAVAFAGNPDLRGVEFTTGSITVFGHPCGGNVRVRASFLAGQTIALATRSGPHDLGALGALIVGFSRTSHQGIPLPAPLDPLLGTSGCELFVSVDFPQIGFVGANNFLDFSVPVPSALSWFPLYVQHAVFETVPGGMTWTTALQVRTRL